MPEGRLGYGLYITPLRLNAYYKLWYKVVFRMLVQSCGPNAIIFFLTIWTVFLLKGSNRSRRQLFQMSESLLDRYNSKETMLSMVSMMLVIKFLLFRSLSFMLDIWEVTFGYGDKLREYIYVVDISNFFILLNSATNCLIFLRGSTWLQSKIVQRNTMKRKRQLCIENLQSLHRVNLIFKSWQHALFMTNRQLGVRVLYSMLIKNPQMVVYFNPLKTSTSINGLCDDETTPNPPPTPAACPTASNRSTTSTTTTTTSSSSSPAMVHPIIPVLVLPKSSPQANSRQCPVTINQRAAEVVAAMPNFSSKKRSLDLLSNPIFHEIGDRIMHFMGELIDSMRMALPDQVCIS
uniref:Gustatory receptor n=1 Tax=Panagrolaimus superbus TaxID=310955 RepID=A0A914XVM6_9BILA